MKIVTVGEVLIRLTGENFENNSSLKLNYGGSEFNVAANLATWNPDKKVYFLTVLNQNNFALQSLMNYYGIKKDYLLFNEKGRTGLYWVEKENFFKPAKVSYDREYSSFSLISQKKENDILKKLTDTDLIFISGISFAVSNNACDLLLKILQKQKETNPKTLICFDFNFRSKLWNYELAKKTYEQILPFADVCFVSANDIELILKLSQSNQEVSYHDNLFQAYKNLSNKYPNLQYLASTKRNFISHLEQTIEGFIFRTSDQQFVNSNQYQIKNYLDRIGTGDAFASGIMQKLICENNNDLRECIEFGIKANVAKHYHWGDNAKINFHDFEIFGNNQDLKR